MSSVPNIHLPTPEQGAHDFLASQIDSSEARPVYHQILCRSWERKAYSTDQLLSSAVLSLGFGVQAFLMICWGKFIQEPHVGSSPGSTFSIPHYKGTKCISFYFVSQEPWVLWMFIISKWAAIFTESINCSDMPSHDSHVTQNCSK